MSLETAAVTIRGLPGRAVAVETSATFEARSALPLGHNHHMILTVPTGMR